jgi:hypothetical protein
MSAIEQPAARSGRTTLVVPGEDVGGLGHEVHAAEDDELGIRTRRRVAREFERVAGDVCELDHLVALVVVTQHEDPFAQRILRGRRSRHQVRVGGRGQVAWTLDPALGVEVTPLPKGSSGRSTVLMVES